MQKFFPTARFENLVVQELEDEVLIYDTRGFGAYCLNKTSAEVWKLADGTKSISRIAAILSRKFNAEVSEELVIFALNDLANENLLDRKSLPQNSSKKFSRRETIRRIALASLVVLPVVTSLSAPQAVSAASACPTTGTACRCRYATVPSDTSCVNTDPLECNSANCRCFFGPNPALACSEITPGNVVCLGVCQT